MSATIAPAAAALSGLDLMRACIGRADIGAPIATLMNMRLVAADPGTVTFEGTPTREHYNPLGTVHGGYAATLLDSCMGCAVHTTLPAGTGYTSIDLAVTFVRAMTEATGTVTARGEVLSSGRRVATVRGTLTDAAGKLLAHGTSSCLILPPERAA